MYPSLTPHAHLQVAVRLLHSRRHGVQRLLRDAEHLLELLGHRIHRESAEVMLGNLLAQAARLLLLILLQLFLFLRHVRFLLTVVPRRQAIVLFPSVSLRSIAHAQRAKQAEPLVRNAHAFHFLRARGAPRQA